MEHKKKLEVLAPAGSFESMKAAVAAGADAVYLSLIHIFYDTTGKYTMGFIGSAALAVAAIALIVAAKRMAEKMEAA